MSCLAVRVEVGDRTVDAAPPRIAALEHVAANTMLVAFAGSLLYGFDPVAPPYAHIVGSAPRSFDINRLRSTNQSDIGSKSG